MSDDRKKRLSRLGARLGIAGIALAATLGIAACGGDDDDDGGSGGGGGAIDLVAYSTPQQAFEEGLIPAFTDTDAGSGVDFSTSFGASGDQRRAIEAGQPADVVDFSLEPDMLSLVDNKLVADDWNSGPTKGIISSSVVSISTRPGNPEGIESFDDLLSSVSSHKSVINEKFARSVQQTRNSREILEKKFEEARRRAAENPNQRPPNPFDNE